MTMTIRTAVFGSTVLALAAGAGGGATNTPTLTPVATDIPAAAASLPAMAPVSVTLHDFTIEPATLTGRGSMTINIKSDGPTPHNFTIRDAADITIAASKDLRTGESDTVDLAPLPRGDYTYFCSFAGHESLGMRGTLTITN